MPFSTNLKYVGFCQYCAGGNLNCTFGIAESIVVGARTHGVPLKKPLVPRRFIQVMIIRTSSFAGAELTKPRPRYLRIPHELMSLESDCKPTSSRYQRDAIRWLESLSSAADSPAPRKLSLHSIFHRTTFRRPTHRSRQFITRGICLTGDIHHTGKKMKKWLLSRFWLRYPQDCSVNGSGAIHETPTDSNRLRSNEVVARANNNQSRMHRRHSPRRPNDAITAGPKPRRNRV